MTFWLKNGLLGFAVITAIWGIVAIVYDICIETITGNQYTISWQTQEISKANPVIPGIIGFIVGGLAIHFFKIRYMPWFAHGQPWQYYAFGFMLGAVFVAFTWTQRNY